MNVICPKCQFENQTDQNTSRVICARCATIIDVGMGYETNFGGYDANLRPTVPVNYSSAPGGGYQGSDVYATRIDDDFDDVLDIPQGGGQQSQYQYEQYGEQNPAFEDVFGNQGNNNYDLAVGQRGGEAYYQQEQAAVDNPTFDPPSYGAAPEPDFMGWPVLPEDSTDPGMPPSSAFSEKRNLLKPLLFAALLGIVSYFAYNFIKGNATKKPVAVPSSGALGGSDEETPKTDEVALDTKPDTAEVPAESGLKTAASPTKDGGKVDPKAAAPGAAVPVAPVSGPAGPAGQTGKISMPAPANGKPAAAQPTVAVKPPAPPAKPAPATAPAAGIAATPNRGNITIQVASFSNQAEATDRVGKLQAQGVTARVVTANLAGRGTWHRVQVGRFGSRDEAARYLGQLRSKGIVSDAMVTPVN